jgi:hypothetical protein
MMTLLNESQDLRDNDLHNTLPINFKLFRFSLLHHYSNLIVLHRVETSVFLALLQLHSAVDFIVSIYIVLAVFQNIK